jgi:chitin synthase
MDLGVVIQDSQSRVDVEMITEEADANALYDEATNNLKYRAPVIRPDDGRVLSFEKEQAAKDYYASVRTNVSTLRSLGTLRLLTTSLSRCYSLGYCLTYVSGDLLLNRSTVC